MGLLKFAILCIDLLAWPAIALGYPLFASIRAIETGSKHHMKKLAIYWTLFSLFSLFEFAFVRIIEWIPFWSSVRLVVILRLVLPQFDGACHAYQGFVRPVLWGKVEAVVNMFYKLKGKRLSKRETYLDAVEKYIEENGPEALEKLIAMELNSLKCIDSERDTNVLELQGNNAAMTSKQLTEPDAAARVRVFDCFTEQVQNAQSISSASALNVKEITPPEASAESPPLKRTHLEWTCDLCKVTATTEILLNVHLQGRKHKSKLESLKASLLDAKDTGPSPLVQQHRQSVSAAWDMKGTYAAAEAKEIIPPKETAEKICPEILQLKKTQQDWTCDPCKVTTTSEMNLNAHLRRIKHKSKLETLIASKLGAKDTGPSDSAISKLNHGNVAEELIKETGPELEKLIASEEQMPIAEVEEMTPLEANTGNIFPETLPLNKTQQECTCGLCKVTTTSEITLNDHLQGSKHKSKLEFLKASMLDAKDTGPSPLEQMPIAEVEEMTPLETYTENKCPETLPLNKTQQECAYGLCNVTTTSEITLNDHLQGSKHKPKLESLRASVLNAKNTGPSPLIEVMTPPVASNEERRTKTPLLKKEWRCDVCKVMASSEKTLNAHLKGSKHKAKFKSQKTSKLPSKDGVVKKSCKETKEKVQLQIFEEQWCDLCNLKLLSDANVASHYKGKRHKSNVGKMDLC